jgi:hypothetical protein
MGKEKNTVDLTIGLGKSRGSNIPAHRTSHNGSIRPKKLFEVTID